MILRVRTELLTIALSVWVSPGEGGREGETEDGGRETGRGNVSNVRERDTCSKGDWVRYIEKRERVEKGKRAFAPLISSGSAFELRTACTF